MMTRTRWIHAVTALALASAIGCTTADSPPQSAATGPLAREMHEAPKPELLVEVAAQVRAGTIDEARALAKLDLAAGAAHAPSLGAAGLPEHLVAALGLTDEQRARVEQIVATQKAASDAPDDMRGHVQRTLHLLAAILPVLDATQRDTLATLIEARAAHAD